MLSTWTFDTDDFVVQKVSHDVGEFRLQELNDKETQLTLELSRIQQHKKKLHIHMHPFNPFLKYENTDLLLLIFSFLPTPSLVAFSMCSRMTLRLVKENWEQRTRSKYGSLCPKHCDKPWDVVYRTIEQNEVIAKKLASVLACPFCEARQQVLINPEGRLSCAVCHSVLSTVCVSLPLKKIKSLAKKSKSTSKSTTKKNKSPAPRPTTPSSSRRRLKKVRPSTASLRSRPRTASSSSLVNSLSFSSDDDRLLYARELVQWRDRREHKQFFRAEKPNFWYCYGCAQSNNHFSREGYYGTKMYTISNYHVDVANKQIPVLDCRYGVMCASCVRHRSMRLGLSGFK
mmetsp:Transcript_3061/g.4494  ORF Transcript_3061/g.4494 Transcript_3061/m.4494 type:complete len:343 (+) Transcript_3061:22-1050(+)